MPLLSICIPTFNRSLLVFDLVSGLLNQAGDFEICVYVDGSSDNTLDVLGRINNSRLRVGFSENRGRASALYAAVKMARGNFIMIFDDDDQLSEDGLRRILIDCQGLLPKQCVGFIYHMVDDDGRQVGSNFPVERSNFIALRADYAVSGDKKEVVLADALRSVMHPPKNRRVPTSMYWSKLAINFDVICRNVSIGRKHYLSDGMTSRIRLLKVSNVEPLIELYRTHIQAFASGRYTSWRYVMRSLLALMYYATLGFVR